MSDDKNTPEESEMNELPDDGFPDEFSGTEDDQLESDEMDSQEDVDSTKESVEKENGFVQKLLSNHFKKVVGGIILLFAMMGYMVIGGNGDQPSPSPSENVSDQSQQTPKPDTVPAKDAQKDVQETPQSEEAPVSDEGLLFDSDTLDQRTADDSSVSNNTLGIPPVPEPIDSPDNMKLDFDVPTPADDTATSSSNEMSEQSEPSVPATPEGKDDLEEESLAPVDMSGDNQLNDDQMTGENDGVREQVMSRLDEILDQVSSTQDQVTNLEEKLNELSGQITRLDQNKVDQDRVIELSNQLSQLESRMNDISRPSNNEAKDNAQKSQKPSRSANDSETTDSSISDKATDAPKKTMTAQSESPQAESPQAESPSGKSASDKRKGTTQISQQWVLKSATPDSAWVAQRDGTNMRRVTIGDTVMGVGQIQTIEKREAGWVVKGSREIIRP